MSFKFSAERLPWSEKVALRLGRLDGGDLSIAKGITFEQIDAGRISEPFLYLLPSEAQELVNQLYAAGIKPEQAAGSSGQLESTRYHLEDMRRLVFKGKV